MGADGALTLILSSTLILLTAGLSWLLVSALVLQRAVVSSNRIAPADWILVLGRRLLGSAVTLEFATRLDRAVSIASVQPQARIMVLGGKTAEGPFSEAEQGRSYLLQRGIAAERVHTEDRSMHTLENLQNARDELGDAPGQILLITSRYHLARSHTLARGLGLQVQACAAEAGFDWRLRNLWRIAREGLYLHWYWVDKSWCLLTGNRESLARIS